MLFDRQGGVLMSGDALWEDGFGVVFPELDGTTAFADVGAVLDRDRLTRSALGDPGTRAGYSPTWVQRSNERDRDSPPSQATRRDTPAMRPA